MKVVSDLGDVEEKTIWTYRRKNPNGPFLAHSPQFAPATSTILVVSKQIMPFLFFFFSFLIIIERMEKMNERMIKRDRGRTHR